MDGGPRLGDGARGEGTREVSTCGKEVETMSSESSRHREWGGEGFFTSSLAALPGPLTTGQATIVTGRRQTVGESNWVPPAMFCDI